MDKIYQQIRFASLIRTPYEIKGEIDDTEYPLTLMLAATSFVKDYPNVIRESYSVEGVRNAIAKLLKARREGKTDIMRAVFHNISFDEGKDSYFFQNCQSFYAKVYLLDISDMEPFIEKIYVSALAKLDKYISFCNLMKEKDTK